MSPCCSNDSSVALIFSQPLTECSWRDLHYGLFVNDCSRNQAIILARRCNTSSCGGDLMASIAQKGGYFGSNKGWVVHVVVGTKEGMNSVENVAEDTKMKVEWLMDDSYNNTYPSLMMEHMSLILNQYISTWLSSSDVIFSIGKLGSELYVFVDPYRSTVHPVIRPAIRVEVHVSADIISIGIRRVGSFRPYPYKRNNIVTNAEKDCNKQIVFRESSAPRLYCLPGLTECRPTAISTHPFRMNLNDLRKYWIDTYGVILPTNVDAFAEVPMGRLKFSYPLCALYSAYPIGNAKTYDDSACLQALIDRLRERTFLGGRIVFSPVLHPESTCFTIASRIDSEPFHNATSMTIRSSHASIQGNNNDVDGDETEIPKMQKLGDSSKTEHISTALSVLKHHQKNNMNLVPVVPKLSTVLPLHQSAESFTVPKPSKEKCSVFTSSVTSVDITILASQGKLANATIASLRSFLVDNGVTVKAKTPKVKLIATVMQYIKES